MILGLIGDSAYKLLLAAHILAVVGAFGPTLVYTLLSREAISRRGEAGTALASISPLLNKRVSLPALVIAILAGIGLVIQSDFYKFSATWISMSFSVVLLLGLLSVFIIGPRLKAIEKALSESNSNEDQLRNLRSSTAIATGLFHLGMMALVILMIWKPGNMG